MRSLILLALCACAAPPLDRDDVHTLLARIVPADAPRALAVAMGNGTDAPAAAMSSYTYEFAQRTASSSPWLQHWQAGGFVHDDACYAGEEFRICWALSVGKAPGPWPRQAWVLATSRTSQAAVDASDPKATPLDLTAWGHPGVRFAFIPTMSFESGNSLGLVEYDASGRVILRWTPPEVAVGSVWFVFLLWIEPPGKLMVSRAIQFRVGRRP